MKYLDCLIYLIPALFVAGFLDGIAGGGGIIALPAYLMTGMPVHSAYACNKLQSGVGTLIAGVEYVKNGYADLKTALIALPFTIAASFLSTRFILNIDEEIINRIIVVCMPIVIIMMILKRKIVSKSIKKQQICKKTISLSILSGILIGTYDGLFGPGCGTTAMIVFSVLMNYDLCVGNANGKIIILVSNITAMINYIASGYMIYYIAIPCALVNMAGSFLGAKVVIKNGERVVFPAMLTLITMLALQTIFRIIGSK